MSRERFKAALAEQRRSKAQSFAFGAPVDSNGTALHIGDKVTIGRNIIPPNYDRAEIVGILGELIKVRFLEGRYQGHEDTAAPRLCTKV